jgi:hypothetical protein
MVRRTEIEDLKKKVEAATVRSGVGYKVRRAGGGTVLDILPGSKGGSTPTHPFQIFIEPKEVTGGGAPGSAGYRGYVQAGKLFASLRPTHTLPITGLTPVGAASPTWFDVLPTDAIYLETTYDTSGNPTTTLVRSWGTGGAFDPTAEAWSIVSGVAKQAYLQPFFAGLTPVYQLYSRILLGYTLPNATGAPELTQTIDTDLLLRDVVVNGVVARYPFAMIGGYYVAPTP